METTIAKTKELDQQYISKRRSQFLSRCPIDFIYGTEWINVSVSAGRQWIKPRKDKFIEIKLNLNTNKIILKESMTIIKEP